MVTAYDYPTARCADRAGVDSILVGDSLGMVVQGHSTTLPVTVEDTLYHTRCVTRAAPKALVVADMPFLSYQVDEGAAVANAGRMLKEGGASGVKVEGGAAVAPLVRRLVSVGIPVLGHLGLTPQSVHVFGGFRVQAREPDRAREVLADAEALEAAGAFGLILEHIPAEVARAVTESLRIPTIGIGAGPHCDGEVQVLHDLIGLVEGAPFRHTKRYAEVGEAIREALARYAAEVRDRTFPGDKNTVHQPELDDPATWRS